ncbi:hypothetical protein [Pseudomonas sp. 6D_7.1_Bac1]|uniref:hypothetical protein n=1 Tax=Pseudomonas sp. 6D_7.1_Bac1 TaxID=2971615 RepID=UPI0021C62973|nr:hypothetical protein [Pseudomonas sp. 6D_7.1_Bac1]MCU1752190.1 hypothetical protein [Pseudomonas sp. 6D_7.1_Bac1]
MSFPSEAAGKRIRWNVGLINAGQDKIITFMKYEILNIANKKMEKTLESVQGDNAMACHATVCSRKTAAAKSEEIAGDYCARTCIHAEMEALEKYMKLVGSALNNKEMKNDLVRITVTSPPCLSCAFVLELFGVLDKIKTTKDVYKGFTSSWKWPDGLKKIADFDPGFWLSIQAGFKDSGCTDDDIVKMMVKIIEGGGGSRVRHE